LIEFENKPVRRKSASDMLAEPAPLRAEVPGEVSIKSLLVTLWRRRWVMVLSQFVVVGLAVVWASQIVPTYVATSLVVLNSRQPQVLRVDPAAPGLVVTQSGVETEVEVLLSPALAERVVDKLQLIDDPELNPALAPEPSLGWVVLEHLDPRTWLRKAVRYLRKAQEKARPTDGSLDQDLEKTATISRFLSRLRVENPGASFGSSHRVQRERDPQAAQARASCSRRPGGARHHRNAQRVLHEGEPIRLRMPRCRSGYAREPWHGLVGHWRHGIRRML
jgi:succinoglycan biosynthesis transport protein ExoP